MRIAKWIAIILGGIVVVLVAAAFVLTAVIDPNRFRGKIEGIVADLTGKPLVIEGDLAITWYPWLGIRTGPAHLDDPALVQWQSINVATQVWPLLHGEVVVNRIRVQSPHIHLRRDRAGHGNWEGLGSKRGLSTAPASGSGTSGGGDTGSPAGAGASASTGPAKPSRPVQIAGIEIRDGTIDYVDEASGLQATLANVELDVGEWRAGQPLPVHTRFLAHTQSLPPNGVWVELDAPDLAIRPRPLSVAAPKLTLKVANAQADGDLTFEQVADAGATTAGVHEQTAIAGATTAGAHQQTTDAHAGTTGTHGRTAGARTPAAGTSARDNGMYIRAHGAVVLRTPSVRELANGLGLNQTLPHDPTTLGPLELTTTWNYDDGSISAKPLALKLDGVSFNGWLQRTAGRPKARWDFELHGDRIDLGRYFKVDSKHKKPFELPVEALRAVNANGSLIFDQVVLADTHMADVRLKLQTPEGKP